MSTPQDSAEATSWLEQSEVDVIIRIFRPRVQPGKRNEFEQFLRDTAVPLVSSQDGILAQHIGRPFEEASDEFVYVTVWKDLDSLRRFAGANWQEAVIDPSEVELLRETFISHYEVIDPT